ncbi:MAG: hypothetical protein K2N48_12965 [Muribaculaceae bacterium]|nr:hypothetical protein [Muribaculaceae bacterium]
MGYEFRYNPDFLKSDKAEAVSLTLPLTELLRHIFREYGKKCLENNNK